MANFIENLVEKVAEEVGERRQYREYKERVEALAEDYRTAVEALEKYLLIRGSQAKGDALVPMLVDLGDLFERAAADGTSIRAIVGNNPVEFAETFLAKYPDDERIETERDQLIEAIDRAAGDDTGNADGSA